VRLTGFIGPSYTLQSVNVDCQRCVNYYPEVNELGAGKEHEVASLVGTPGLRVLATLPTGPVRGEYTSSDGQLFAVGGNKLYKVSSAWVATEIGTLNTNTGPVSLADNGLQVVAVDGTYGYVWTIATSAFAQITDPAFPGADQVTFQDGYFLFNKPDSEQFFISALNGVTFDALDIASAEGSPDLLVAILSVQRNLWLFGSRSTEVFYDSGNADFPFERIQGAFMETGCSAPFSVAKLGEAVYWLGQDDTGSGIVYRAQGYQPQRVSTHPIENVISKLGDISAATAWTYSQGGHQFYCLNIPGADSTWVFDATTNLWHERAYLDAGYLRRHRAACHAFAYNTHVVGDYESGKLYALDQDTFSDDGNAIARIRSAPHFSQDLVRLFHSSFQLDMETGVGLNGSGQGSNPQVVLDWSDDGGHSWSNEHWADAGKIGARLARVIWRRLGASRDRVYRTTITDPVKVTLIGAEIGVEQGDS